MYDQMTADVVRQIRELTGELDALRLEVNRLTGELLAAGFMLKAIRDYPIPEQDNMSAANMRKMAASALGDA